MVLLLLLLLILFLDCRFVLWGEDEQVLGLSPSPLEGDLERARAARPRRIAVVVDDGVLRYSLASFITLSTWRSAPEADNAGGDMNKL